MNTVTSLAVHFLKNPSQQTHGYLVICLSYMSFYCYEHKIRISLKKIGFYDFLISLVQDMIFIENQNELERNLVSICLEILAKSSYKNIQIQDYLLKQKFPLILNNLLNSKELFTKYRGLIFTVINCTQLSDVCHLIWAEGLFENLLIFLSQILKKFGASQNPQDQLQVWCLLLLAIRVSDKSQEALLDLMQEQRIIDYAINHLRLFYPLGTHMLQ